MRRLIALTGTMLISVSGFATTHATNSSTLDALSSAWRSHPSAQRETTKNDITIVYGGADVDSPTLVPHVTTA